MRLVCYLTIGGVPTLKDLASTSNVAQAGAAIKTTPGVGQPFLFFASLTGHPSLCDFDLHPDWAGHGNLVTSSASDNADMINAMLASPPTDAITY